MNDNAQPNVDPYKRIAELEEELARVKRDRDMFKDTVYDWIRDPEIDRPDPLIVPFPPGANVMVGR